MQHPIFVKLKLIKASLCKNRIETYTNGRQTNSQEAKRQIIVFPESLMATSRPKTGTGSICDKGFVQRMCSTILGCFPSSIKSFSIPSTIKNIKVNILGG